MCNDSLYYQVNRGDIKKVELNEKPKIDISDFPNITVRKLYVNFVNEEKDNITSNTILLLLNTLLDISVILIKDKVTIKDYKRKFINNKQSAFNIQLELGLSIYKILLFIMLKKIKNKEKIKHGKVESCTR